MTKLYKKICKYCGKEFESVTPGKQICPGPHYQTCPICGKEFEVANKDIYRQMCCSEECKNAKRNTAVKTAINKLPVGWNKSTKVYTRNCKFCGEAFTTSNPSQKYCDGRHYKTCIHCGQPFEVNVQQILNGTKTCSNHCRVKNTQRVKMTTEYVMFANDPYLYISNNFADKPTYRDLQIKLDAAPSTIQQCLHRFNAEHLVQRYTSTMEQDILQYIHTLGITETIRNVRNIITPYELDIYLPEYKIGIECNPTVTHNSSVCDPWGSPAKPVRYHQQKTDLCEEKGIRLFHIFGYEWTHKQDIIKSMIANMLGKNQRKVFARNCEIRELSGAEAFKFLEQNHRQGGVNSKYRYGLFYKDELVSVMTFSKMRNTIGRPDDEAYELVRFCSKLNTTVVGGASKLFTHFIRFVEEQTRHFKIISFSDRAHTSGNLYKTLGFTEDHGSGAGYMWVDLATDIAYSRISAQKHNIKKFLKDESIDLTKSETKTMIDHGYVQVFDSGTICWKWVR